MSTSDEIEEVMAIVHRYKSRGKMFPRQHGDESDESQLQEVKDYNFLNQWKTDDSRCPSQIAVLLDTEMPGWRGQSYYFYQSKAQHIVDYYNRKRNFIAPTIKGDWTSSKEEFQEYRTLCKNKSYFCEGTCPQSILAFLNREAPNWLSIGQCKLYDRMDESFLKAEGIVQRYNARGKILPKEWRNHKHDAARAQEYKDAQKLSKWKETLKRISDGRDGKGGHNCPPQLQDYLDSNIPGWRSEVRERNIPPMQRAQEIVARYRERGNVIPRQLADRANRPDRQQEFKDAVRLKDWKRALRDKKGGGGGKCDDEIKTYLDENMPGWRSRVYVKRQHGNMYGEGNSSNAVTGNEIDSKSHIDSGGVDGSESNLKDAISCNKKDTNEKKFRSTHYLEDRSDENDSEDTGKKRSANIVTSDEDGAAVKKTKPPPNNSPNSFQLYPTHDDKEISAAAGLVAVHAHRV